MRWIAAEKQERRSRENKGNDCLLCVCESFVVVERDVLCVCVCVHMAPEIHGALKISVPLRNHSGVRIAEKRVNTKPKTKMRNWPLRRTSDNRDTDTRITGSIE